MSTIPEDKDKIIPAVHINNALAKTPTEWMQLATETYALAMAQLNGALIQKCTEPELAAVHDFTITVEKSAKAFKENAKKRLLEMVKATGKRISKIGSLGLDLGNGRAVYATVRTSKRDPDMVEKLLRAKGIDLNKGMDGETIWHINEAKLAALVLTEQVTQKEIDNCYPELSYSLGKTKALGPEGLKEPNDE